MNLVERLNARFNNAIHDGLAVFGGWVDPWLVRLERQAMSNALGRDVGFADSLAAVEAEEEVHEPGFVSVRVNGGGGGGGVSSLQVLEDAYWCREHRMTRGLCREMHASAGHRVSADSSPTAVGDIGPGAGMVPPPPPAPGPSKCTCPTVECELLAEEICDEAEEAELLDEFMELGEFLDSATAEELAAMNRLHVIPEPPTVEIDADPSDLLEQVAYSVAFKTRSQATNGQIAEKVVSDLLRRYRITPR
ncbi:hypothetical protein HWC44_gp057 [Mycobacterium phage ThetaBob]|uniref:Uncharacterized protein n=1 Tax=Mycobacterium phage ThetaBob TaxID=2588513 RepID=A0A4Y6EWY7_9CAUD|nr:hypothetical protein HWC44_gp057 [Mycobacterium phage ThetaBob]QDF19944.1 hypothetical protein SEA_THETABOB_57 [Mycobacterium phage ThetaBob]